MLLGAVVTVVSVDGGGIGGLNRLTLKHELA
jgi:hypothetical protein